MLRLLNCKALHYAKCLVIYLRSYQRIHSILNVTIGVYTDKHPGHRRVSSPVTLLRTEKNELHNKNQNFPEKKVATLSNKFLQDLASVLISRLHVASHSPAVMLCVTDIYQL